MKTRLSQQNKTNIFWRNNSERSNANSQSIFHQCFDQKCFPDALVSQVLLLLCRITWSSFSTCKSCHCTVEGLTFSDPIHKKSAGNLNLYDFCHSPKQLAAVSPFNFYPHGHFVQRGSTFCFVVVTSIKRI
jgi:hypothetical protein